MEKNNYIESLVSIITPAYNSEKYIEECIKSVLDQTYNNWELIIVNDFSIDKTYEVAKKYADNDSRIKVINNSKNEGVSYSRNTAIQQSRGQYLAFLDSDDSWKSEKLEIQVNFMRENNYSFTFTSYEIMSNEGIMTGKVFKAPPKIEYNDYLKNTIIGCLTVILDRNRIGEIKVEHGNLEDVLTWMKLLKMNQAAFGINFNLANYRLSTNSVSRNKIKNAKMYYNLLRKKQKLSFVKSVYFESAYLINAIKKRVFN